MTDPCSNGQHYSSDDAFCDVCGESVTSGGSGGSADNNTSGSRSNPNTNGANGTVHNGSPANSGTSEYCPNDASHPPRRPGAIYCPICQYNFELGLRAEESSHQGISINEANALASYSLTIRPDRDVYERHTKPGSSTRERHPFPENVTERSLDLRGVQMKIGRGSQKGSKPPHIDLKQKTADKGVSHLHAVLDRTVEGWNITDMGSRNGTALNGVKLSPMASTHLEPDSIITLGFWTSITFHRHEGPALEEDA